MFLKSYKTIKIHIIKNLADYISKDYKGLPKLHINALSCIEQSHKVISELHIYENSPS